MPSFATFNANNFFLRYRFASTFAGDTSRKSEIEATEVATIGYVPNKPFGNFGSDKFVVWDASRRKLAARALAAPDGALPDILCLQEVENLDAIRLFNQRYLDGHYPYRLLIDGHDERNIDVGVLSCFPITEIRTHVDDVDEEGRRVFSRDCLEATFRLPGGETLTLLVNHLKSKLLLGEGGEDADARKAKLRASHARRLAQAKAVAALVEARFAGSHERALYAVLGDFNDVAASPYLAPLMTSSRLADVLGAHLPGEDWTYYWRARGRVSRIDHVLASKELARRIADAAGAGRKPHIERSGLGYRKLNAEGLVLPERASWAAFEEDEATPRPPDAPPDAKVDFRFERYPEVLADLGANISDHCPVKVWF
jgi:endonuclease/exonuclease/phosphatase family metal-dependent hydrolase